MREYLVFVVFWCPGSPMGAQKNNLQIRFWKVCTSIAGLVLQAAGEAEQCIWSSPVATWLNFQTARVSFKPDRLSVTAAGQTEKEGWAGPYAMQDSCTSCTPTHYPLPSHQHTPTTHAASAHQPAPCHKQSAAQIADPLTQLHTLGRQLRRSFGPISVCLHVFEGWTIDQSRQRCLHTTWGLSSKQNHGGRLCHSQHS